MGEAFDLAFLLQTLHRDEVAAVFVERAPYLAENNAFATLEHARTCKKNVRAERTRRFLHLSALAGGTGGLAGSSNAGCGASGVRRAPCPGSSFLMAGLREVSPLEVSPLQSGAKGLQHLTDWHV